MQVDQKIVYPSAGAWDQSFFMVMEIPGSAELREDLGFELREDNATIELREV